GPSQVKRKRISRRCPSRSAGRYFEELPEDLVGIEVSFGDRSCGSAILEVVTVDVLDTAGGLLQRGEGQQACPRRQEAFALPSFQLDTVVKGRCPRSIAVGHIGRKTGRGRGCHRRPSVGMGQLSLPMLSPSVKRTSWRSRASNVPFSWWAWTCVAPGLPSQYARRRARSRSRGPCGSRRCGATADHIA